MSMSSYIGDNAKTTEPQYFDQTLYSKCVLWAVDMVYIIFKWCPISAEFKALCHFSFFATCNIGKVEQQSGQYLKTLDRCFES